VKANDYQQLWELVAAAEEQSLPKSAAAEVDKILRQAVADKNNPQVIKALIHQGKYDLSIDSETDTLIFHNLNDMLQKTTDKVEKAVLHSMLGELYLQYYQKDRWLINQRTELGDFVPADMKEWTRNIFYDKTVAHLNASLQAQSELEKAQVESYAAVVELGDASRRFFPSMYDFLALRAKDFFPLLSNDEDLSRSLAKKGILQESLFETVNQFITLSFNPSPKDYNLWTLETYRKLLSSLQARKMDESALLVDLQKLDYLQRLPSTAKFRRLSLQAMFERWEGKEISAEIVDRITFYYLVEGIISDENPAQIKETQKQMYDLLNATITKYPNYERINLLKNRLAGITMPALTFNGKNTFPLKGEKRLKFSYKNLSKFKLKIYRTDAKTLFNKIYNYNYDSDPKQLVKTQEVQLRQMPPYAIAEDSIGIDINEYGAYIVEVEIDTVGREDIRPYVVPHENNRRLYPYQFSVSDLSTFFHSPDEGKYEIVAVDRVSGKPIENAQVVIYNYTNWRERKMEVLQEATTDKNGLVQTKQIDRNKYEVYYQITKGKDKGTQFQYLYSSVPYGFNNPSEAQEHISIFTDRGIYLPGQTIYFKAVSAVLRGDEPKPVSAKKYNVELLDANSQKIAEKQLTTNEFGSLSGEFVLPQNTLLGFFSLKVAENAQYRFRVEEYKRPTFEIAFDKIEKTYKFGEKITLKGKAENFSGIKLQNATVSYRIVRSQILWGRWWGGNAKQFAQGKSITDEDGTFQIDFTPEKDAAAPNNISPQFNPAVFLFNIEASVTDLNGETQTASYSVSVGDVSMLLNVEMGDKREKSVETPIVFSAKNLDGADISASGTYKLSSLQDNDSVRAQVSQGDFKTGEQKTLQAELKKLPSGKYRLELQSKDDQWNTVNAQKDFVLYAFNDKKPPLKTNDWYIEKNLTFSADNPAEIILGVSDKDVQVLYEIWQEKTLLERKWISLSNENKSFKIACKPEYKNAVSLFLTYVKDEKFYAQQSLISLKTEKKQLAVKLDVFRDKLLPGAKEEWRISVTDAQGKPALAEVLASMYDLSLDKIYESPKWNLNLPATRGYSSISPYRSSGDPLSSRKVAFALASYPFDAFSFDKFNWHGFSFYQRRALVRSASVASVEEVPVVAFDAQKKESVVGAMSRVAVADVKGTDDEYSIDIADFQEHKVIVEKMPVNAAGATAASQPQIRRNFNETAFFYPQLRTDENGELQIAFTVPESNTRWKFRVLAQDKNLRSAQAEAIAVSQKELMLTPNMPRFLRQGDITTISSKISNLSDAPIGGTARLVLFNPLTDEAIASATTQQQPFSLEAGKSGDASWTFEVPNDIDLLGVRVIAESASFSDGEQHALAVLPKRMMLTESLPIDVNGKQSKQLEMSRITDNEKSKSAENYRLTLEFASNPAWYAVQALPVLSNPNNENAVSWFASFYANTLGMHIGKTYPKVSAMIEAWKKQGGNEETLLSKLEKNEELKNVLLEETPWVLEAKNESEQKQKLSLLFNLNRNQSLCSTAIAKLQELQTAIGGWAWFKGFKSNRGITQYILYGFNQLQELNAMEADNKIVTMQRKAVPYIDSEALRGFEQLKQYNKDWKNIKTISSGDLEYLYVRSAYTQYPMDKGVAEMTDFYTSVAMKNWTRFDLYERSLIAVLAQRKGQTAIVQDILKSYREHASLSDEMGMFWANNRAHVFMSQSAVSVHTFIMDTFKKGGASASEMDDMKRWLLNQKQTQLWESTHATIDAVYALLSTGNDWFAVQGKTKIALGKSEIAPEKTEAGTGYFKESWGKSEIAPDMAQVKVQNEADVPAWGALYLQYFEDLDKIAKTDTPLDIEKMLFVEQTGESGKKLVQITENKPLKVGDKVIVRLTVRADRDLEFVHLKDMRAACFEPSDQLSGIKWQNGTLYYQTSKDASTHFYFDALPRGTYVFEYAVFVTRTGSYSNGITSLQCLYAPQFTSHTDGIKIYVK
jgi:uncharacterized protein YfaS (alpha-2-macroglobulin family)